MYHSLWRPRIPYGSITYSDQEAHRSNTSSFPKSKEREPSQPAQLNATARSGSLTYQSYDSAITYTVSYRQREIDSTSAHPLDQSGLGEQRAFFHPGYSAYGPRAQAGVSNSSAIANAHDTVYPINKMSQNQPSSDDRWGRLASRYMFQQAPGYDQNQFLDSIGSSQDTGAINLDSEGLAFVSPVSEGSSFGVTLVEGLSTSKTDNADDSSTDQLHNLGLGTWRCNICSQVFRRKQRAYIHFNSKHGNTNLICGGMCGKVHCAKIFSSPGRLMAHLNPDNVRCPNCQRIVLKKNILRHQSQHCHP